MAWLPHMSQALIEDIRAAGLRSLRSCWLGDDGRLRRGRSGDLVTMLDDLGVPNVTAAIFERPRPVLFVSSPCAGHSRPMARQAGGLR